MFQLRAFFVLFGKKGNKGRVDARTPVLNSVNEIVICLAPAGDISHVQLAPLG